MGDSNALLPITATDGTPLLADAAKSEPHFRLWGRVTLPWRWTILVFAAMTCIGSFGQQVALPMYLAALGDFGGPYFVLWFCSAFFTVFFGTGSAVLWYHGQVSKAMMNPRWHLWMLLVGLFDALNGVFVVYSAPLTRVPGPLQSILLLLITPFTFIFSKLLLHHGDRQYRPWQLGGVLLVLIGAIYSFTPLFVHAARGDYVEGNGMSPGKWWWPLVLVGGVAAGAMMNVTQEHLQDSFRHHEDSVENKRMSVFYFQAVESFYQLCWMSSFFFFDLIPNFGFSSNVHAFGHTFESGFRCFFGAAQEVAINDRCSFAGGLGMTFIISYICTYIFSTFMTLYATANYISVVTTLPPVLGIIFWFVFPSVNSWAQGTPYGVTSMDGAINITALLIIIPGIILYRRNEVDHKTPLDHELSPDGYEEIPYFPFH